MNKTNRTGLSWSNPDDIKKYHKKYYLEKIANRDYYVREKGIKTCVQQGSEEHKQLMRDWYYNHKEEVLAKQGQLVKCDICNCELRRDNLYRHNKSKKHIKNLTPK